MGLKHAFKSVKADPADPTIIGATKWNDDHYYVDGAGAPVGNVGALLLAGAAGALTHLNSVAAGSVLTSAGVGALPVWAAPAAGVGPGTNLQVASLGIGQAPWVAGSLITATGIWSGSNVHIGSGAVTLKGSGDGRLTLSNMADDNFSLLQFGGTTAAFPALKRSGNALHLRGADDSGWASLYIEGLVLNHASAPTIYLGPALDRILRTGPGSPEGVVFASRGSIYLSTDGGASTTLWVKQTGDGTATGWVGK